MVSVGRVVRPQGHRGEVVVDPETDFPERRFANGATLFVRRGDEVVGVVIDKSRPHQHRWVIAFAGFASIEAAETLRDAELRVPESELAPLEQGTFWVHELLGCEVVTIQGTRVGEVRRVDLATGVPMLVLDDGGELLVPLVDAICRTVDVQARRITIDPPEGLIDLNRRKLRADGR
jgi:16S rRNA processing protein RimM